jgi:hypothetical protein
MKKKLFKMLTIFLLAIAIASFSGCYGRFVVTKKIYNWNGSVSNKYVNSAIMWLFIIIPVYGLSTLADFLVLNTIEFWTGSNPLAMGEDDKEIKLTKINGKDVEITATKDRFDIRVNPGKQNEMRTTLIYNRSENTWYAKSGGKLIRIASLSKETPGVVNLYHPDGEVLRHKL